MPYTIKVDYENNTEEWWAAARASTTMPEFLRPLIHDIECGEIVVSAPKAKQAKAWCASLPGWNDGPEYAIHTLLIDPDR